MKSMMVRLGVVALVIVSVVVVLRIKQAENVAFVEEPSAALSSLVLTEPSRAAPAEGEADETTSPPQAPEPVSADPAVNDGALPRLLDLGADKCIPCKKMAPILEALREDFDGQFEVVFIDVWKNKQAARPYGINLIPTQIFFDPDGQELFRHQGFFSREDILAAWSDLGYVFETPSDEQPG